MTDLISREAAINAILHSAKNMRKRQLECTFDVRRLRKHTETDFHDAWLKRKKEVSAWMTLPKRYKGGAE